MTTTCNKCGAHIAFVKSARTGKSYPVNVLKHSVSGELVADRRNFHNCNAELASIAEERERQTKAAELKAQQDADAAALQTMTPEQLATMPGWVQRLVAKGRK